MYAGVIVEEPNEKRNDERAGPEIYPRRLIGLVLGCGSRRSQTHWRGVIAANHGGQNVQSWIRSPLAPAIPRPRRYACRNVADGAAAAAAAAATPTASASAAAAAAVLGHSSTAPRMGTRRIT